MKENGIIFQSMCMKHYVTGNEYMEKEIYSKAIQSYDKALKISPCFSDAANQKRTAQLRLKQQRQGRNYRKSIKLGTYVTYLICMVGTYFLLQCLTRLT